MKKYQVYRQFWVDGEIEEYFWGEWLDKHAANEAALELRYEGACDYAVVKEVEA